VILQRRAAADLLVPVVGAVALLTYALHGVHGMLTRDLAIYSYAGQQVAEGVPPYLGVLNRAGPLAHLIPAVGVGLARLGGFDDVLTMRLLFMALATACACAVYLFGRDVFRSSLAGLVTAATFLTFSGFIEYASNGPREKTPMTLFVVCALWAVTKRRWFTAGVFVSLATLCLQIAFFTTFTAAVAGAVLLAPEQRARALARIVLGGAVPAAACVVYFAVVGSLREFLDAFVVINATYTTSDPLLPRLGTEWGELQDAYGLSVWLLLGGLVALGSVAAAGLRRKASDDSGEVDRTPALLGAFTLGVLAGLAWNLREYDDWPDLFPLLPLAALGVGALFTRVAARASRKATIAVALSWSVAASALAIHDSATTRDHRLVAQRESVTAVLAELPDDATITSVEAPQALVLTRRRNPTRHQMFSGGLSTYVDATWPGGIEGFRRSMVEDEPTLIVFGDPVSQAWRDAVAAHYEYVGRASDWFWYARASLGEETLEGLRDAAGFDPTDEFASSVAGDTAP
jgi:hypothetical protein